MRKLLSISAAAAALFALAGPSVAAERLVGGAYTRTATDISAARRHRSAHVRRVARFRTYKPTYYGRAYRPYAYGWAPPYAYNPYGPYHAAPFPFFPYFGYGWAW